MARKERTRPLREDVRAGLLAAAREVFGEVGYHRASLDAIAARAGYSKGAVYSNFTSKEELFLDLLKPEALSLATGLQDLGTGAEVGLRRLAIGLQTLVGIGTDGNLVFAEFRAQASRDPGLAARLAEMRAEVVAILARGLEDEVARLDMRLRVPATDAVIVLLALVNGLSLEQIGLDAPAISVDTIESVLRALVFE